MAVRYLPALSDRLVRRGLRRRGVGGWGVAASCWWLATAKGVAGVGWWGVLVGGDVSLVASSGSVLLLVGKVDWGGLAGGGERRLQEAARPELSGGHDVEFLPRIG